MKKKLQIFISSTFTDLQKERQAVVEAVLMAGHIPAGMELFAAGDKSQLETIRRWIGESDVFMLILGGRYGSIEETSGKSYIELEYEYALEQGKPVFAAVISDECLDQKVKTDGRTVIEQQWAREHEEFKRLVTSKMCRFFDDAKDLKLIVHESLSAITHDYALPGWVRGDEVPDITQALHEMSELRAERTLLAKRLAEAEKKVSASLFGGHSFEDLVRLLQNEKIPIAGRPIDLLGAFIMAADDLAIGVSNFKGMSAGAQAVFFTIAPRLAIYGLVEKKSVNSRGIQRFQLSPLGVRFLNQTKTALHEVWTKKDELVATMGRPAPSRKKATLDPNKSSRPKTPS